MSLPDTNAILCMLDVILFLILDAHLGSNTTSQFLSEHNMNNVKFTKLRVKPPRGV